MHSHRWAYRKMSLRVLSTTPGAKPKSPQVMGNSGLLFSMATASAVAVFPTPGAPWSRMVRPLPLPRMTSRLKGDLSSLC